MSDASQPVRSIDEPVVLAVDGGGSKTDVLAIDRAGATVARARGAAANPQLLGWPRVRATLDALRAEIVGQLGGRPIAATHVFLAGLDLPQELDTARRELAHWGEGGPQTIDNDLFALLRAGTDERDAVAVVCGTGINAIGIRSDGATARFPALGEISGDWGGGSTLGALALWHAARAEDGRGPDTELRTAVPEHFGLRTVRQVSEGLHFGRIPADAVPALTPLLFVLAEAGDLVAGSVVDRQAQEVVLLAGTVLDRLELTREPVPVVLGGSVLAARDPRLVEGVRSGLAERAPLARISWVTAPPVLGAALLALEHWGAPADALAAVVDTLDRIPAVVR